jgi:hypothetical protein
MNLKELVEESLQKAGYEGLFNADIECACQLGDLMPCGEPNTDECCPGYKATCDDRTCEGFGHDGHFHIAGQKPVASSL